MIVTTHHNWRPDALGKSLMANPIPGTLLVVDTHRKWFRYHWRILVGGKRVAEGSSANVEWAQVGAECAYEIRMGSK